jgi:hypothetical protein
MEANLFSEQWALWQEVWPKSGMTVDGQLFELAMPAHHIGENESSFSQLPTVRAAQGDNRNSNIWERDASKPQNLENALWHILPTPTTQDSSGKCLDHGGDLLHDVICGCERSERRVADDSLLRTPSVVDSTGGAISETQARERGRMVKVADQAAELAFDNGLKVSESVAESLLPTPTLGHLRNHDEPIDDYLERRGKAESGEYKGMPGVSLGVAVRMETMPTPTTRDWKDSQAPHERNGVVQTDTVARAIFNSGEIDLIGTPRATASESSASQVAAGATKGRIEDQVLTTNWGKFEPAIRRWEALTRPAPAPTKPDGKDGNHRLSSAFTEWMMGLPDGWVTGHGLKRNDELKMCGNGVVPQQAELALRFLLGQIDSPKA